MKRNGQQNKDIRVVIVTVECEELWPSHECPGIDECDHRHSKDLIDWKRIVLKRTVAGAAVDGQIPLERESLRKYASRAYKAQRVGKRVKAVSEETMAM